MNIDGVNTGIVLDHIKAGKSMMIYELLRLDKLDCCVAIIQNAKSQKYGLFGYTFVRWSSYYVSYKRKTSGG